MNKIKIAKYDDTVIPRYFADHLSRIQPFAWSADWHIYIYIFFSLIVSVTFLFSVIFRVIS